MDNGELTQRAANFTKFHGIDRSKLKTTIRGRRRGSTNSTIPEFLKTIRRLEVVNGQIKETYQNCIWEQGLLVLIGN